MIFSMLSGVISENIVSESVTHFKKTLNMKKNQAPSISVSNLFKLTRRARLHYVLGSEKYLIGGSLNESAS